MKENQKKSQKGEQKAFNKEEAQARVNKMMNRIQNEINKIDPRIVHKLLKVMGQITIISHTEMYGPQSLITLMKGISLMTGMGTNERAAFISTLAMNTLPTDTLYLLANSLPSLVNRGIKVEIQNLDEESHNGNPDKTES